MTDEQIQESADESAEAPVEDDTHAEWLARVQRDEEAEVAAQAARQEQAEYEAQVAAEELAAQGGGGEVVATIEATQEEE